MTTFRAAAAAIALTATLTTASTAIHAGEPRQTPTETPSGHLWDLARSRQDVHRYSTLFTAQNVRDLLATESGLADAVDWCRRTGVTKAYVETFRDGYLAPRGLMERARDGLRRAGLDVAGCVTTTQVGKRSTGWNIIACYTDPATQERLREIFEYTASLFDEIMIDDFWFTDCECPECNQGRRAKAVAIGDSSYPIPTDSWEDYRGELLFQLSRTHILEPARRVNPDVRIIIKYPQWYDNFHLRGYDVKRETEIFDRIWVGTETRDYDDERWGGTAPYEAYFLMRWLGRLGGPKCGGGWFDPYGTTEATYIEQARQTILAGARESLLFCYGSLREGTGPANIEALRANLPELLDVADEVRNRQVVGVAAYKPPGSHPENEARIFDFVGMIGLPLVPCHEFPMEAPAAFFSVHALKDSEFVSSLAQFLDAGKPVLLTDGLAAKLKGRIDLERPNVHFLMVNGDPKSVMDLPQDELERIRTAMLAPLHRRFQAPGRVALYLFEDGSTVIENFRDESVEVRLDGETLRIEPRGWLTRWR